MTTALTQALARAKAEHRAALIGYLPVGFPDVPTSIAAMRALVAGGCDIVEVGVPYSDPVMDGPVIQRATEPAVRAGVGITDALRAVSAVAEAGAAAVTMGYWNQVERYGVERFARDLAAAGGSGAVTPDLIPDEAQEWVAASTAAGVDRIFLLAPSSTDQRVIDTVRASSGFVYASAVMGVTGARDVVGSAARGLVERARRLAPPLPVCVGLGVSSGAQAAEIAGFADGVIVGSALVRRVVDAVERGDDDAGVGSVRELAEELAAGVRATSPSPVG